MDTNNTILLNSLSIKNIFQIAVILEINNLPINKVCEGINTLIENVNLNSFSNKDDMLDFLLSKARMFREEEKFATFQNEHLNREIVKFKPFTEEEQIENDLRIENNRLNNRKRAIEFISDDSEEKQNSILVLCADNNSFLNQRWKKILDKVEYVNDNLHNYKVYYIGKDLTQVLPFRIQGNIKDILPSLDKFDIIISEHCPGFSLNAVTQQIIYDHLKPEGIFITPDYYQVIFNETCFIKESENMNYCIYNKSIL